MYKMLKQSCRNGASMGKELVMKERKKESKPFFGFVIYMQEVGSIPEVQRGFIF